VIQGSQEWIDCRVGKVTASRVGAVFTQPRKGSLVSKVREAYLADLLAERLTGKPSVPDYAYGEEAKSWGTQTEPFALAAYETREGYHTALAGFIDHPRIPMSGASPDGLVGDDGGVEIKCPNTATHLETIRKGKIPTPYIQQMRWNMCCTGRSWWDFVSFDPRVVGEQYFCLRLGMYPNEKIEMEMGVFAFVMELEARLAAHQWMEESQCQNSEP
jgi:putative phage-type endonuclease